MEEKKDTLYAVIRIRGSVKTVIELEDTMNRIGLRRVNNCTVVPADPTHTGMLNKADSHLTWGEVDKGTLTKMIEKRGRTSDAGRPEPKKAKAIAEKAFKSGTLGDSGLRAVFRLSPPSKGLKSIRLHYPGETSDTGVKI